MNIRKIKVWLPTIKSGTGSEIFSRRLADALERMGLIAHITMFPLSREPFPFLLRNIKPPAGTDLIFANSCNGFVFERHNVPLIVTVHHAAFDPKAQQYQSRLQRSYHHYLIRPYEMRSLQVANVITAVSNFAACSVTRATGRRDIRVLPNWVDTQRYYPIEKHSRKRQPFRLLYVGRPSAIKGSDLLLPIMRRLGSDFELLLAGRWPPHQSLPSNVRKLGWLNEAAMIAQYQECDALLFPSRFEGFGYAVLEAMACGKPVITSNSSAMPELVDDGVTGVLCPMNDIDAFINACKALAIDPDRCASLGAAARTRAFHSYSEQAVIPRYLELIRELAQHS